MAVLLLRVAVDDANPLLDDPHDVANELIDCHQREARVGNTNYRLAPEFTSAEWSD